MKDSTRIILFCVLTALTIIGYHITRYIVTIHQIDKSYQELNNEMKKIFPKKDTAPTSISV